MPTANWPHFSAPVKFAPPGVNYGTGGSGNTAVAIPHLTARVRRVGPLRVSLGKRYGPGIQATVAGVIAQVSVGNQHFTEHHPMGTIQTYHALEVDDVTVRARPVTEDGTVLFSGDVVAIDYSIFDRTSPTPATATQQEGLSVAQHMFTTLQVTQGWRKDATGFSFQHTISGAHFREGGRRYRVEYIFTRATGKRVKLALDVLTSGLLSPRTQLGA